MKIAAYITDEIFRKRLDELGCLAVYDPDRRFQELCQSMAGEHLTVVDASESSIAGRETAMAAMRRAATPSPSGERHFLLVYVPTSRPEEEEDLQRDPFSAVAVSGGVFPRGDGDLYEAICRQAKPDYAAEITRLFEDGTPDFATVDALDAHGGWPQLKTVLDAESPAEILVSFLAPAEGVIKRMDKDDAWVSEARLFLEKSLGLKLVTKGKKWKSISNEVWEYLLFSEFAFDLPGELPGSLQEMSRADPVCHSLVETVCDRLRKRQDTQETYVEMANKIEDRLKLEQKMKAVENLGNRDTFAFEERSFLGKFIKAVESGDLDRARSIDATHGKSVWLLDGMRFSQWTIARHALELIATSGDLARQKGEYIGTQSALIEFYAGVLRELDRRHRELEQAVADSFHDMEVLDSLVDSARAAYRSLAGEIQVCFTTHLEKSGWPCEGMRSNTQVFDQVVAPLLNQRKKVAYVMIDALRYELGVELHKGLADTFPAELLKTCAQLPTITPVGMSSLLPQAADKLAIRKNKDGKLTPAMGDTFTPSAPERKAWFAGIYGDRYHDVDLEDFVKKKRIKVPETTQLLTVRSWELDRILHNSPRQLVKVIPEYLGLIRAAVHKLRKLGFDHAVIATDHGFILLDEFKAGDSGKEPPGKWILKKDRCRLGKGTADGKNVVISKEHAGIRGEFEDYATPKGISLYTSGEVYFHSGASLQECILPVITIDLGEEEMIGEAEIFVTMSYRKGATDVVTTLAPVIELAVTGSQSLFSDESEQEVAIEITDSNKKEAGSVAAGPDINQATNTVRVQPGLPAKVRLRMAEDFRGNFTVKALDPVTRELFHTLKLKLNITE